MANGHQSNFEDLCERDRSNLKSVRGWAIPFFLTFMLAVLTLGPTDNRDSIPLWQIALAILPFIPGYFALRAYFKFAKEADELIKHVMNEAAAKSFAVVIVLGFIYSMVTQIFGEWKDSGVILWVIGYLTYQILFVRAWRRFNA